MSLREILHRRHSRRALTELRSGLISPAEAVVLREHLDRCPVCVESLRRMEESEALNDLLRAAAPQVEALPDEAARALFARALELSGALPPPLRPWRHFTWAVPVLLVMIGGAWRLHGTASRRHTMLARVSAKRVPSLVPEQRSAVTGDFGFPTNTVKPRLSDSRAVPGGRQGIGGTRQAAPVRVPAAEQVLEVIALQGGETVEWLPDGETEPAVESSMASAGAQGPRRDPTGASADSRPVAALTQPAPSAAPEVEVRLTRARDELPGRAWVSTSWTDDAGERWWKQAHVASDRSAVEMLLVSISRDRVLGFWKEKTE